MDMGTLVTIALAAIGGLGWLYRLEGRINTHDALFRDAKERLEILEAEMKQKINKEDCSKRRES